MGACLNIVRSDDEVHALGPKFGGTIDFGRTEITGFYLQGKASFDDRGEVVPGSEPSSIQFLGQSPSGAQGVSLGLMGSSATINSQYRLRRAVVAVNRDLDFLLREMPSLTAIASLQGSYGHFRHNWMSSQTTPRRLRHASRPHGLSKEPGDWRRR